MPCMLWSDGLSWHKVALYNVEWLYICGTAHVLHVKGAKFDPEHLQLGEGERLNRVLQICCYADQLKEPMNRHFIRHLRMFASASVIEEQVLLMFFFPWRIFFF